MAGVAPGRARHFLVVRGLVNDGVDTNRPRTRLVESLSAATSSRSYCKYVPDTAYKVAMAMKPPTCTRSYVVIHRPRKHYCTQRT